MKVYKTREGIVVDYEHNHYLIEEDWDKFINNDKIYKDTIEQINSLIAISNADILIKNELLPPIGTQEIWASGVTYMRSRSARMEESKDAGGGDFYDRVYSAERPELFFKSSYYRASGSGQAVKIRKDSNRQVCSDKVTHSLTKGGCHRELV